MKSTRMEPESTSPSPQERAPWYRPARIKGSVLLVTLLLAMIMGSVAVGYLQLTAGDIRVSDSAYLQNALLNLAEAGAEEATWVLNREEWDSWVEFETAQFAAQFQGIDLGSGRKGSYVVVLSYPMTRLPMIHVEAEIETGGNWNRRHVRQLEIELEPRSLFSSGMVARDTITLNGNNFTVDSFDSSIAPYNAAQPNDNGSIGSASIDLDSVVVGNANVFGTVATGKEDPDVGPNGMIWGKDSDPQVLADNDGIDPNRVSTDFSADFKDIEPPETPVVHYTNHAVAPPHQRYMGEDGESTFYKLSEYSLSGQEHLTIRGDVTLVVDGDISLGGQSEITLADGANVTVYVGGDVSMGGNTAVNNGTVLNPGIAQNFLLFGTNPESGGQSISLQGNGQLAAAVYAPNAHFTMGGGGSDGAFYGAVVAQEVQINGGSSNYGFHYDEALAPEFADGSFKMVSWKELHAAGQRISFDAVRAALQ